MLWHFTWQNAPLFLCRQLLYSLVSHAEATYSHQAAPGADVVGLRDTRKDAVQRRVSPFSIHPQNLDPPRVVWCAEIWWWFTEHRVSGWHSQQLTLRSSRSSRKIRCFIYLLHIVTEKRKINHVSQESLLNLSGWVSDSEHSWLCRPCDSRYNCSSLPLIHGRSQCQYPNEWA